MLPAIAFSFEQHSIRVVDRDGNPWWVLADVCEVLELSNVTETAKRLDQDELSSIELTDISGRQQAMLIVSEPGLYKVLRTSRKPVAKRFVRWNDHEVLPSIRETGSYLGGESIPRALAPFFEPVHRRLDDLESGQNHLKAKIEETNDNVIQLANNLVRRKDFSDDADEIYKRTCIEFENGYCPDGCGHKIVDENGEWVKGKTHDHNYTINRANRNEGWAVLMVCNHRLRDPKERQLAQVLFHAFQRKCDVMEDLIRKERAMKSRKNRGKRKHWYPGPSQSDMGW